MQENALLLQKKDSKAFYDKKKEENEELIKEWITMLSKEQLSAFVDALKGMDAAELYYYNIKEALRDTRSLLKAGPQKVEPQAKKLRHQTCWVRPKVFVSNPRLCGRRNVHSSHRLSKQFRNAQNAHNPLVAAM